jgi:GAF domain-containing protein
VDRAFDRHRYDYRKALVDFGRGLSSETNLEALLDSIVERLPRALLVARVAVFLAPDSAQDSANSSGLRLAASHGLPAEARAAQHRFDPGFLDLAFLDFDQAADHSHIFLENAQAALHLPPDQQRTAALLDLNYYLPCRVQDGATTRTIAVIGLGRTIGGDFLSSEDVELLESLASYIGIALQNASLYARLQSKIS